MMGSVGELPQAPAKKTVFVEDMTDAQLASAVSKIFGLLMIKKSILLMFEQLSFLLSLQHLYLFHLKF